MSFDRISKTDGPMSLTIRTPRGIIILCLIDCSTMSEAGSLAKDLNSSLCNINQPNLKNCLQSVTYYSDYKLLCGYVGAMSPCSSRGT